MFLSNNCYQCVYYYVGNLAGSHVGVCLVMHLLLQLAYHDKRQAARLHAVTFFVVAIAAALLRFAWMGSSPPLQEAPFTHGRLGWHPDGHVTGQCEQKQQHAKAKEVMEGHTDHITTCGHRAHKRPHSRRSSTTLPSWTWRGRCVATHSSLERRCTTAVTLL